MLRLTDIKLGLDHAEGEIKAAVLKRLDLKGAPPLAKIFDFSLTRKVMTELQSKNWRSGT